MEYDTVVGIEIHLELNTQTKMFSGAPYKFKSSPNTCVNEIDLAYPGSLPSLNKEAVKKAIMICLALNLDIDRLIRFDRKNYYYSDLPRGFQITQQFHPIGRNGYLEIINNGVKKKIEIERAHLEEDAAKQTHLQNETLIDFNRAGVALLEIVSKASVLSGTEAALFIEKLRQILEFLGASDVKMEEGSLRADVNVSVMPKGSNDFGTRVEIKNINSISSVKEAIDYETNRQIQLIKSGAKVIQETRRFDEKKMTTIPMRLKQSSIDYKYFPEPNIPPTIIDSNWIESIKKEMPELPNQKYIRYINDLGLSEYEANLLLSNKDLSKYYDQAVKSAKNPKNLCNLLCSELLGLLSKNSLTISNSNIKEVYLAKLSNMYNDGIISSKQVKTILEEMMNGKDPIDIIKEKNIKQISNEDEIKKIVLEVLKENPKSISDYKNGKNRALGYLVSKVISKSKGQANPKISSDLLTNELNKR